MSESVGPVIEDPREANKLYFLSLADGRFSLLRLPLMAFISSVMLAVNLVSLGSLVYLGLDEFLPLWRAHLVMIVFGLAVFLLSLIRWWVFRFQVFSTALMTLFGITGWLYGCCYMGFSLMAMFPKGEFSFDPAYAGVCAVLCLLFLCGSFAVNLNLLHRRLRYGHSWKRTLGNLTASSRVYSPKSMWTIFAVVTIGPNLLTQGTYAVFTLGLVYFLLAASVMPALVIELVYFTLLKSRDRVYWEERPPKRVLSGSQVTAALWKVLKIVLIIAALVIVVEVLNYVLPRIL
ncbi:hypothetical protein G7067_07000 [Leucobacter insecticola]|uniref:Uncharacterized protein n=1 Tax=Leucobacter insecticola TaxID=2714934 RepID=A0A6G8FIR8_9MICO|nr:hypothetical protein [Leucobacter insecticola]QIM16228.1 hypothetical protein G7067_07000 [Leucobacter insecticola]